MGLCGEETLPTPAFSKASFLRHVVHLSCAHTMDPRFIKQHAILFFQICAKRNRYL